jgi:transcriptional regulator with XRE-family HTH domain
MRDDRETDNERVEPSPSGLRDSLRAISPAFDSANAGVETELEAIAVRVRHWRDGSNLTLQELARRSGVAASTIQKIETQQMVPSIAVLLKIAHGLGCPLADLVRSDSGENHVACLRAENRRPVGLNENMRIECLVGDLSEQHLEVWRITHEPGSGSGRTRFRFDGETLIVCESGEITFYVADQEFVLRAGDTLHFKSTLSHGWRNEGTETTTFLNIGTLPSMLRTRLHQRLRNAETDAPPERGS